MLRITATTAVGTSRQALLAGLQPRCQSLCASRQYSTAETSFSVHVPKANRQNNRREAASSRQHNGRPANRNVKQRSSPRSSTSFLPPPSKRVLALGPRQTLQTSTASSGDVNTGLIDLQRAIDGQDITSIFATWTDSGHCVQQLGQSDHRKLLRLCSSYASNISSITQAQQWAPVFKESASAASLSGDVDLIQGWFKILFANGQAPEVVDIWKKIVATRLEHGSHQTLSKEEDVESEELADTSEGHFIRLDESNDGDRVDIHDMVCLVAFAGADSSRASDFVELFDRLEFGSPFRLFFNMPRAKRLYSSISASKVLPASTQKLTEWDAMQPKLWEAELARGLSSGSGGPQRVARLLGSFFQLRQVDEAYAIFQTAMRASSGPGAWLALESPDEAVASSIPQRARWTESCWSVCLSNFIALGRTELAMDVWKQLQQRRIRPTPRIWNAVLDGYGRAKNHAAAVQTWEAAIKASSAGLPSSEKQPDELMYTTMISTHFRAKQVDPAMALFSDMKAKSNRIGGPLHIQAETFNAVVHGLFLNGRREQAQGLLDEMIAKGPAPSIGTINTFLRAHARIGDLESLAATLRLADKLKLTPDVVTFTTLLDALLRSGGESATDAVVKTLGIMNIMGVQPNVVTYTAMIKACLVGAEAAQLDIASQSLLGDAAQRKRRPRSSDEVRIEAALELLDRMLEAKVAPSEITYSALIGGCLQNPDAVAHAFATKALPRHYSILAKPLQRLGETSQQVQRWSRDTPHVSLALLLLEHMKGRGLLPTSTTFRFLIEGLCSPPTDQAAFIRSMDLIDDMLLRTPLSEPSRPLGPFASTTLKGNESLPSTMHAPSHTTWIIIFSSILDRLENGPRDKAAVTTCARALGTAIRLVREMGSLSGAEGGMSLSRLVERSALLTSKVKLSI